MASKVSSNHSGPTTLKAKWRFDLYLDFFLGNMLRNFDHLPEKGTDYYYRRLASRCDSWIENFITPQLADSKWYLNDAR